MFNSFNLRLLDSMGLSISIEEKQILVDGLKVNYKQSGNGDNSIILLHGWGISSDKYLETIKYLPQFSVIAPDLPGFGKSDNPPEVWGVSDYAEFIKKFIYFLNPRRLPLIMIGHSFGGQIAIKFAVKYPEMLKALILTGAAGIRHAPTFKQNVFYVFAKIGKIIFSLPMLNRLEKSAKSLLYKAAREKDYHQAQGIIKKVFKKVVSEDLTEDLEKIVTPALLVWGRNDYSVPLKDGEAIHFKIQNSKLEIFDKCNHSLPYQAPEKFAKIVVSFVNLK